MPARRGQHPNERLLRSVGAAHTEGALESTELRRATKTAQWTAFLRKNRLQTLGLVNVVTPLRDEFNRLFCR